MMGVPTATEESDRVATSAPTGESRACRSRRKRGRPSQLSLAEIFSRPLRGAVTRRRLTWPTFLSCRWCLVGVGLACVELRRTGQRQAARGSRFSECCRSRTLLAKEIIEFNISSSHSHRSTYTTK
jgi:hypothetical protein